MLKECTQTSYLYLSTVSEDFKPPRSGINQLYNFIIISAILIPAKRGQNTAEILLWNQQYLVYSTWRPWKTALDSQGPQMMDRLHFSAKSVCHLWFRRFTLTDNNQQAFLLTLEKEKNKLNEKLLPLLLQAPNQTRNAWERSNNCLKVLRKSPTIFISSSIKGIF